MESKTTKITKDQILIPDHEFIDFCIDDKYTVIGWLQKIYLYPEDDKGYIPVNSKQHRDIYDKAINVLRKHAGLTPKSDLLNWECNLTITKAVNILNKVINEVNKNI